AKGRVAAAYDDDIRFRFRHLTSHTMLTPFGCDWGPQVSGLRQDRNSPCGAIIHVPHYSAAAVATPPWAFDQPAGPCMNFSISASFAASNLPLSLATASTSHQVASECSVTPRSLSIFRASGKMS